MVKVMAAVILSNKGKDDINKIKAFYKNIGASPYAVRNILEDILNELSTLETFPEAGHKPDDPYLKARNNLCWVIYQGRHIVFYVYNEGEQIVRIRRILPTKDEYLKIIHNKK